jgi:hypothetical protein
LKLAIELIDDLAARPLRGIALLLGEPQFLGQGYAECPGAGISFARVISAAEDVGGRIDEIEHRVRRGGLCKAQYVLFFAGRRPFGR